MIALRPDGTAILGLVAVIYFCAPTTVQGYGCHLYQYNKEGPQDWRHPKPNGYAKVDGPYTFFEDIPNFGAIGWNDRQFLEVATSSLAGKCTSIGHCEPAKGCRVVLYQHYNYEGVSESNFGFRRPPTKPELKNGASSARCVCG